MTDSELVEDHDNSIIKDNDILNKEERIKRITDYMIKVYAEALKNLEER